MNIPKPKTPKSRVQRAEMMKQRYQQLKEERDRKYDIKNQIVHGESFELPDGSDFASNDDNLPAEVRRHMRKEEKRPWNDVEPAWKNQDPRKRISWPEFCRDFMGQNYGAIAQDLLQMHASGDPALQIQFLKFMMEMGKQGNPSHLQLDINAQVQAKSDIYSQLSSMSGLCDPAALPQEIEAQEQPELPEECEGAPESDEPEQCEDQEPEIPEMTPIQNTWMSKEELEQMYTDYAEESEPEPVNDNPT